MRLTLLLTEDVQDRATKHPILERVDVSYRESADHRGMYRYHAFEVRPRLILAVGNDDSGSTVGVYAASALDPWSNWGGDEAPKGAAFRSEDRIIGVHSSGGSSWTSGAASDPASFLIRRIDRDHTDRMPPVSGFGRGDLLHLDPQTQSLDWREMEFGRAEFDLLKRFTKLRRLDLSGCQTLTDEQIGWLGGLAMLEKLTLNGAGVRGSGFSAWPDDSSLEQLDVYQSRSLTAEGITAIARLGKLERLNLHWAETLDDQMCESLTVAKHLKALSTWGSASITDRGLGHLAIIKTLEELTFSHSKHLTAEAIN